MREAADTMPAMEAHTSAQSAKSETTPGNLTIPARVTQALAAGAVTALRPAPANTTTAMAAHDLGSTTTSAISAKSVQQPPPLNEESI